MTVTRNDTPLPNWLETAWLERYLDRRLSVEENEFFEAYMLDKPHLIAEIEADTAVRDGLARLPVAVAPVTGVPPARPEALASRRQRWRRHWQPMAWAASLALAWAVGWTLASLNPSNVIDPTALVVTSPPRLVFDTMRGVETPPLVHPGDPNSLHVLVEVGLPPDAQAIALHLPDSATVMPLVLSPDGFVTVLLPRHRLTATPPLRITYHSAGSDQQRLLLLPSKPSGDSP
ncbi:MAG TPA: hypothetical protein DDZ76_10510 [Xanthomonadales bacterium]|nr:hypothetical protein [Xanthomonadales bacterium]